LLLGVNAALTQMPQRFLERGDLAKPGAVPGFDQGRRLRSVLPG
jgi:hypothetical protein